MNVASRRTPAWPLYSPLYWGLYLFALGLRAWVNHRTASIYPDGVVDLEIGEALLAGDWRGALELRFHPLFGALCACVVALTGLSFLSAGSLVAVSVSALVAPAVGRAAASLVPGAPRSAAFCAGVLAACHPYLVRLGAQVMNYPVAHACLALALWAAALALERRVRPWATFRWFLLAGVFLGLGYTARSDALASGAGLGLGSLLALWAGLRGELEAGSQSAGFQSAGSQSTGFQSAGFQSAGSLRALLLTLGRAALPLALGALLGVAPFLLGMRLHHGAWVLSPKKPVATLLAPQDHPTDAREAPAPTARDASLDRWISREAAGGGPWPADPPPPGLWGGARFALSKALHVVHPLLLGLLLGLGLVLVRSERRPLRWGAALVPALSLGAFVGAHVLLKASVWGYTSNLHQSALGIPVAILSGALLAGAWRARAWPRSGLALTLGALAVVLLPKALEPQLVPKGIEAEVGRALRAHAGPGPILLLGRGELRPVSYAARAFLYDIGDPHRPELAGATPAESLRRARAEARRRGARPYLGLYYRWRQAPPGELERELERLGARAVPGTFETHFEGRSYTWRLYLLE